MRLFPERIEPYIWYIYDSGHLFISLSLILLFILFIIFSYFSLVLFIIFPMGIIFLLCHLAGNGMGIIHQFVVGVLSCDGVCV